MQNQSQNPDQILSHNSAFIVRFRQEMPYCFDYTLRHRHYMGSARSRLNKKSRLPKQPGWVHAGKILVMRISAGSSMENMQIIQGYTVFLVRNIMVRQPPVMPRGP